MAIIESVKELFSKVLSIGKPSDDDVLYSKIIKKEIPKESAEELTLMEIKETVTHLFHDDTTSEEVSEFSRGAPTPTPVKATPTKKTAKKKPAPKKTVAKKPATKKTAETEKKSGVKKKTSTSTKTSKTKKTTTTKSVAKKPATPKKEEETKTTAKKPAAPKGTKRAEKIALYIKDIKKHYGEVDEDFVTIIVKNLGPSIYKKDAELVSCSDPKELDTVRKNFLMKKLGIDASQSVLDTAIADVCQELKSTRTKYRATFYYALAKKFKKESVLS
ncbi:DUF2853 family protein [Sulfurovum sp.]|uniref:DUF2853 family protein n=1 Tax=Sulfurovum sp. TaxID=1969726 RepID=UPI0028682094|nr:DUF2853 family protein [Sulfurovum sp.]